MNVLIVIVGVGLAAATLVTLVGLIVHAVRVKRGWFGGSGLSRVLVRMLCIAVLIAGFVMSADGLPLASRTSEVPTGADTGGGVPAESTSTSWQVPFYVQTTLRHTTLDGAELGRRVTRRLTLPWPFLVVVALYLFGARALGKSGQTVQR